MSKKFEPKVNFTSLDIPKDLVRPKTEAEI